MYHFRKMLRYVDSAFILYEQQKYLWENCVHNEINDVKQSFALFYIDEDKREAWKGGLRDSESDNRLR